MCDVIREVRECVIVIREVRECVIVCVIVIREVGSV